MDRLRYQEPDCGSECWQVGWAELRPGMERTVRRSRDCYVKGVRGIVAVPGRGGGGTELRVSGRR